MTNRPLVVAFALLASPVLSFAQTPATTDTAAAGAVPAAPAPVAPTTVAPAAPVAPADTASASGERPSTYTVQKGDAVATIAHRFGITWEELRKANHLKKKAILQPGQVLQIPPAKAPAAPAK